MDNLGGIERLTERQKEILRLLSSGHDVKSAAVELGISVYTVNDHLSESRKHLGASNSRAAVRLYADLEGAPPQKMRGPTNWGWPIRVTIEQPSPHPMRGNAGR